MEILPHNVALLHICCKEEFVKTLTLEIEGMSCGHCLNAVTGSLSALTGVLVQSVQLGRATVAFDPDAIEAHRIAEAVEQAGFRVATIRQ
ncbi:MAG TPA: cation transporter [Gemmatimonadales bacterium]|jgi:copper chaperone CopZ|nr:cation transporter [Gemmatimonadales bacterium]